MSHIVKVNWLVVEPTIISFQVIIFGRITKYVKVVKT